MEQLSRVPWPRVLGYGLIIFGVANLVFLIRAQFLSSGAYAAVPTPFVTTTVYATAVVRVITPTSQASIATKIRISTATQAELESLPSIGPSKAKAIIQYREQYGFKSVNDLEKVKGIGPKTMGSLRPLIEL